MDYDPVSALTDVMRVLASTPADFTALCLEVWMLKVWKWESLKVQEFEGFASTSADFTALGLEVWILKVWK